MTGSNNVLFDKEWDVFYIRVPAFAPSSDWEVVETGGLEKVMLEDGEYYIPRNGVGYMKIRKKVDLVVFKEGRYYVKLGETYTQRAILFGDFGVRVINIDDEVNGIDDPSPKNLTAPEVPGKVRWVVLENAYGDPDYVNVLTEDFTIDLGDERVTISPKGLKKE